MPPTVKTDMISSFSQLRSNPLLQSSHIHSYSFIPNIRIIGEILPARKNSKIAIMRSCHLVLVQSANIYVYSIHTYPYRLYEFLRTGQMQLRMLICIYDPDTECILAILCSLWRKIYAVTFSAVIFSLQFPFHSNHPLHYQFISSTVNTPVRYCCLITALYYSFIRRSRWETILQFYHYHTPALFHTSTLRFEANY